VKNVAVLSRQSVHNAEMLPNGSAKFPVTLKFAGEWCTMQLRALLQCNGSKTRSG
jgi:hypothetical protein